MPWLYKLAVNEHKALPSENKANLKKSEQNASRTAARGVRDACETPCTSTLCAWWLVRSSGDARVTVMAHES